MSLELTASAESLRRNKTHRFAHLWKILRLDGTQLFFTDHNRIIPYQGQDYNPSGGYSASARRSESGLRERNMDIAGAVSEDRITNDDLRAGRYRSAEITETLVDWRFPFAGALKETRYWVDSLDFDGELWHAEVTGLSRWLRQKTGDIVSRPCGYDLGDPNTCRVDLSLHSVLDQSVTSVSDVRRVFTASSLAGQPDDKYAYGEVIWTAGDNVGIRSEVKTFESGEFGLYLRLPFDIEVGDRFTAITGCDKLQSTCGGTFNNLVNCGCRIYVPTADKVLQTPTS